MGETAFDALGAAFDGLVDSGSQEDVDVLGHDGEAVKLVAAFVAIVEERFEDWRAQRFRRSQKASRASGLVCSFYVSRLIPQA